MRVLRGPVSSWKAPPRRRALAVGVFDGVHLGHRRVLDRLRERARQQDLEAGVVTFDPHPLAVIAPERAPLMLATVERRLELLAGLGVETTAVVTFDERLREWSPATFITDLLVGTLHAGLLVVGEDFRFGRDRTGHVGLLRELGGSLGFDTEVVPLVGGDSPISSSQIRQMIAAGDVAGAAEALARPYEVIGTVVPGEGRGRSIGVPTANLEVHPGLMHPGRGVYAVWCGRSADESLPGVANVGVRPTFGGGPQTLEAHLIEADLDLRGGELRVRFVERLREERAFSDVDALTAQIRDDIEAARKVLAE